jgi:integrase
VGSIAHTDFRAGLRTIRAFQPLSKAKLDEINSETVGMFTAHRQADGLQISTINSSLRVLRRVLRVATEWGALEMSPKVGMLPRERHRVRVISFEQETRYLAFASEPLQSLVAVLIGTGMRPDEAFRLCWDVIAWSSGRYGTLLVTHAKTAAARRVLPVTARVRDILAARWDAAGRPDEGWVLPAPTRSSHIESSSLKKRHSKVFERLVDEAKRGNRKAVRRFVLYSLRHTFLTTLGESGCDVRTLARIDGHSSIKVSYRYVHPSDDAVLDAMNQLGGHKIGHNPEQSQTSSTSEPRLRK